FNQNLNNDIKLWLGRRYYDRKSIHIMSHYWLNPGQNSQAGSGIEDITAGSGKINIAMFRYEDNFDISGTSYLLNSTSQDARWHDINISDGLKLTLWAGLSARHKLTVLNYDEKSGYGLSAWLDYKALNTKNTIVLIYQTGAAITQSDFNPNPVREDTG
ncbi:MAG: carbohydrate porin, partial [Gammaproteobacteria bacterium]|nr:carbohydrate porin [Gammaproteobacteria bacterium]